jgi:translation initiation factor 2 beta subunit (eIF-2beta)/eIF-5
MSRGDGKNPKFRVLCKACNSYQHTVVKAVGARWMIVCNKCGNSADSIDEEAK